MRCRVIVFAVLSSSAAGGLLACGNGDDTSVPTPATDGGKDGALSDATTGDAPASEADAANASEASATDAGVPSWLLLGYNSYVGASPGEVAAFDLNTNAVAGRLEFSGSGTPYVGSTSPWLLEQGADVVAKLDPVKPWSVDSSWSIPSGPAVVTDAGSLPGTYADPQAVIVNAGTKAYVLPYLTNAISVIDTSVAADAGAPTKQIDLSSLVQAGGDGSLEMTAGVYVASKHTVYVLLANINQNTFNTSTGYLQCAGDAAPTVVAIDTTTDAVVSLAGTADAGAAVALPGRNPAFGPGALAYDSAGQRLLILEGGCTSVAGDGGAGPLVGAQVDVLSLTSNATGVLLDLTGQPLPSQLVYMDATHALIQVGYGPFTTYAWNPTTTTLGAAIPNAPDSFAWDGAANLLGITATYDADSGAVSGYDVLSVKIAGGTVTKLGSNPFSLTGGSVVGVQLWSAP